MVWALLPARQQHSSAAGSPTEICLHAAILRSHAVLLGPESDATPINEPVLIGDWLVDPRDDSLARGTERVKLEPRTMRLLDAAGAVAGQVVSQDELLESVWSGVVVGTASVYQSMSQLAQGVRGHRRSAALHRNRGARRATGSLPRCSTPREGTQWLPCRTESVPTASVERSALPSRVDRKPAVEMRWLSPAPLVLAVMAADMAVCCRARPPVPSPTSIAVLPFVDLTDGRTQQMFCDGLTEETSNWLAQIPSLRVVARVLGLCLSRPQAPTCAPSARS